MDLFSYNIYASTRVEPSRIILNAKLDSRSTGVINVVNSGNEQMFLQAYLFDWDFRGVKKEGCIITCEPETLEPSLNNLIKFNARNLILDPGQSQTVRFTINTPENLNRELRGVVFFQNQRDLPEEDGGARVITQVGTILY